MNKKYFSVLLMGALAVASVGTITSCKDYDDDISGLQTHIDQLSEAIKDIQAQITVLLVRTVSLGKSVITATGGTTTVLV